MYFLITADGPKGYHLKKIMPPNTLKKTHFLLVNKAIAFFLCLTIGVSDIAAYAAPVQSSVPVVETEQTISIPSKLGHIEESHTAPHKTGSTPPKTIIYIQDAHDSLEAQEHIAQIIQHLVKRHGVKTVFEEGYEGPVPTDEYFGFIQDPKVKQKVSYFLMDKLRLSGAEYAHVNRFNSVLSRESSVVSTASREKTKIVPAEIAGKSKANVFYSRLMTHDSRLDFSLIGADSIKLHLENIRQYQRSAKTREQTAKDLAAIEQKIAMLAGRHFPKKVKAWMKLRKRLDAKQLDLLEYLKRITTLSSLRGISPLLGGRRSNPGSEIASASHGSLPRNDKVLLSEQFPVIAFILRAGAVRENGKIKKLEALDSPILFAGINQMENDLAAQWLTSERDRQIFQYYKILELLVRLNAIELSAAEYDAVKGSLKNFDTQTLAQFIVRETKKSIILSKRWEQNIRDAIRFYEIAQERDHAIENALSVWINSPSAPALSQDSRLTTDDSLAILVFGGFHKERIQEMLKAQGVSFITVTPRMTSADSKHQDYYKRLMSVGHHPFETPFYLARAERVPSKLVGGAASLTSARASRPASFYDQALASGGVGSVHFELRLLAETAAGFPELGSADLDLHLTAALASRRAEVRMPDSKIENGVVQPLDDFKARPSGRRWMALQTGFMLSTAPLTIAGALLGMGFADVFNAAWLGWIVWILGWSAVGYSAGLSALTTPSNYKLPAAWQKPLQQEIDRLGDEIFRRLGEIREILTVALKPLAGRRREITKEALAAQIKPVEPKILALLEELNGFSKQRDLLQGEIAGYFFSGGDSASIYNHCLGMFRAFEAAAATLNLNLQVGLIEKKRGRSVSQHWYNGVQGKEGDIAVDLTRDQFVQWRAQPPGIAIEPAQDYARRLNEFIQTSDWPHPTQGFWAQWREITKFLALRRRAIFDLLTHPSNQSVQTTGHRYAKREQTKSRSEMRRQDILVEKLLDARYYKKAPETWAAELILTLLKQERRFAAWPYHLAFYILTSGAMTFSLAFLVIVAQAPFFIFVQLTAVTWFSTLGPVIGFFVLAKRSFNNAVKNAIPAIYQSMTIYTPEQLPEAAGQSAIAQLSEDENRFLKALAHTLPENSDIRLIHDLEEWHEEAASSIGVGHFWFWNGRYEISMLDFYATPSRLAHEIIHLLSTALSLKNSSEDDNEQIFLRELWREIKVRRLNSSHFANVLREWKKALIKLKSSYGKKNVPEEFMATLYQGLIAEEFGESKRAMTLEDYEQRAPGRWDARIGGFYQKILHKQPALMKIKTLMQKWINALRALPEEDRQVFLTLLRNYYLSLHPQIPLPALLQSARSEVRIGGLSDRSSKRPEQANEKNNLSGFLRWFEKIWDDGVFAGLVPVFVVLIKHLLVKDSPVHWGYEIGLAFGLGLPVWLLIRWRQREMSVIKKEWIAAHPSERNRSHVSKELHVWIGEEDMGASYVRRAPFNDILVRILQRGDIAPDQVTSIELRPDEGEPRMVYQNTPFLDHGIYDTPAVLDMSKTDAPGAWPRVGSHIVIGYVTHFSRSEVRNPEISRRDFLDVLFKAAGMTLSSYGNLEGLLAWLQERPAAKVIPAGNEAFVNLFRFYYAPTSRWFNPFIVTEPLRALIQSPDTMLASLNKVEVQNELLEATLESDYFPEVSGELSNPGNDRRHVLEIRRKLRQKGPAQFIRILFMAMKAWRASVKEGNMRADAQIDDEIQRRVWSLIFAEEQGMFRAKFPDKKREDPFSAEEESRVTLLRKFEKLPLEERRQIIEQAKQDWIQYSDDISKRAAPIVEQALEQSTARYLQKHLAAAQQDEGVSQQGHLPKVEIDPAQRFKEIEAEIKLLEETPVSDAHSGLIYGPRLQALYSDRERLISLSISPEPMRSFENRLSSPEQQRFLAEKEFRRTNVHPDHPRNLPWESAHLTAEQGVSAVVRELNTLPFIYTSSWSHSGLPSDHAYDEMDERLQRVEGTFLDRVPGFLPEMRHYTHVRYSGFIFLRINAEHAEYPKFAENIRAIPGVEMTDALVEGPYGKEKLILIAVPPALVDASKEALYEEYLRGKWAKILRVVQAAARSEMRTAGGIHNENAAVDRAQILRRQAQMTILEGLSQREKGLSLSRMKLISDFLARLRQGVPPEEYAKLMTMLKLPVFSKIDPADLDPARRLLLRTSLYLRGEPLPAVRTKLDETSPLDIFSGERSRRDFIGELSFWTGVVSGNTMTPTAGLVRWVANSRRDQALELFMRNHGSEMREALIEQFRLQAIDRLNRDVHKQLLAMIRDHTLGHASKMLEKFSEILSRLVLWPMRDDIQTLLRRHPAQLYKIYEAAEQEAKKNPVHNVPRFDLKDTLGKALLNPFLNSTEARNVFLSLDFMDNASIQWYTDLGRVLEDYQPLAEKITGLYQRLLGESVHGRLSVKNNEISDADYFQKIKDDLTRRLEALEVQITELEDTPVSDAHSGLIYGPQRRALHDEKETLQADLQTAEELAALFADNSADDILMPARQTGQLVLRSEVRPAAPRSFHEVLTAHMDQNGLWDTELGEYLQQLFSPMAGWNEQPAKLKSLSMDSQSLLAQLFEEYVRNRTEVSGPAWFRQSLGYFLKKLSNGNFNLMAEQNGFYVLERPAVDLGRPEMLLIPQKESASLAVLVAALQHFSQAHQANQMRLREIAADRPDFKNWMLAAGAAGISGFLFSGAFFSNGLGMRNWDAAAFAAVAGSFLTYLVGMGYGRELKSYRERLEKALRDRRYNLGSAETLLDQFLTDLHSTRSARAEVRTAAELEDIAKALDELKIDRTQYTTLIYPGSGEDWRLMEYLARAVFPQADEFIFNATMIGPYSIDDGGVELWQQMKAKLLAALKSRKPSLEADASIQLYGGDYLSDNLEMKFRGTGKGRVWIHNMAGFEDALGVDWRFYVKTVIRGIVRPGDIVLIRPTEKNQKNRRKFWGKPLLKKPVSIPGTKISLFIYKVTEKHIQKARDLEEEYVYREELDRRSAVDGFWKTLMWVMRWPAKRSEVRQEMGVRRGDGGVSGDAISGGESGIDQSKRRSLSRRLSIIQRIRSTWRYQPSFSLLVEGYNKTLDRARAIIARPIPNFTHGLNSSKNLLASAAAIIRYITLASIPAVNVLRDSPKNGFAGAVVMGVMILNYIKYVNIKININQTPHRDDIEAQFDRRTSRRSEVKQADPPASLLGTRSVRAEVRQAAPPASLLGTRSVRAEVRTVDPAAPAGPELLETWLKPWAGIYGLDLSGLQVKDEAKLKVLNHGEKMADLSYQAKEFDGEKGLSFGEPFVAEPYQRKHLLLLMALYVFQKFPEAGILVMNHGMDEEQWFIEGMRRYGLIEDVQASLSQTVRAKINHARVTELVENREGNLWELMQSSSRSEVRTTSAREFLKLSGGQIEMAQFIAKLREVSLPRALAELQVTREQEVQPAKNFHNARTAFKRIRLLNDAERILKGERFDPSGADFDGVKSRIPPVLNSQSALLTAMAGDLILRNPAASDVFFAVLEKLNKPLSHGKIVHLIGWLRDWEIVSARMPVLKNPALFFTWAFDFNIPALELPAAADFFDKAVKAPDRMQRGKQQWHALMRDFRQTYPQQGRKPVRSSAAWYLATFEQREVFDPSHSIKLPGDFQLKIGQFQDGIFSILVVPKDAKVRKKLKRIAAQTEAAHLVWDENYSLVMATIVNSGGRGIIREIVPTLLLPPRSERSEDKDLAELVDKAVEALLSWIENEQDKPFLGDLHQVEILSPGFQMVESVFPMAPETAKKYYWDIPARRGYRLEKMEPSEVDLAFRDTPLFALKKDLPVTVRSEMRSAVPSKQPILERVIHPRRGVVFSIKPETLERLQRAQKKGEYDPWLELLGLILLNDKLHTIIDSRPEQGLTRRTEELLKYKNVYLGWGPATLAALPKNVPVIHFEELLNGQASAQQLKEWTAHQVNAVFDLSDFKGAFIAALRYAQDPDRLNEREVRVISAADAVDLDLLGQFFEAYTVVSQAA